MHTTRWILGALFLGPLLLTVPAMSAQDPAPGELVVRITSPSGGQVPFEGSMGYHEPDAHLELVDDTTPREIVLKTDMLVMMLASKSGTEQLEVRVIRRTDGEEAELSMVKGTHVVLGENVVRNLSGFCRSF